MRTHWLPCRAARIFFWVGVAMVILIGFHIAAVLALRCLGREVWMPCLFALGTDLPAVAHNSHHAASSNVDLCHGRLDTERRYRSGCVCRDSWKAYAHHCMRTMPVSLHIQDPEKES